MKTPSSHVRRQTGNAAFTLLELVLVLGLIATLAGALVVGLDGNRNAAVAGAQALLVNLMQATRTHARANEGARLLVNVDPLADARHGEPRYLRMLAVQLKQAGNWQPVPVLVLSLPEGAYLVPGNFPALPNGLIPSDQAARWVRSDGSPLRSTALRVGLIEALAVASPVADLWAPIVFSTSGTTAQNGDLVLSTGRVRGPEASAAGESPVALENPDNVRGVSLSTYGLPLLINARMSF